jgi:antitoxin VapB
MKYIHAISPEASVETAKVFWSGRSQAVRLPKAFRLEQDEVGIRRHGSAVILEPIPTDWVWLDAIASSVDPDFKRAAGEKATEETRPELGFFE